MISHLKQDYRLLRCFLGGFRGDQINLMLAAAAWKLPQMDARTRLFWLRFFRALATPLNPWFACFSLKTFLRYVKPSLKK